MHANEQRVVCCSDSLTDQLHCSLVWSEGIGCEVPSSLSFHMKKLFWHSLPWPYLTSCLRFITSQLPLSVSVFPLFIWPQVFCMKMCSPFLGWLAELSQSWLFFIYSDFSPGQEDRETLWQPFSHCHLRLINTCPSLWRHTLPLSVSFWVLWLLFLIDCITFNLCSSYSLLDSTPGNLPELSVSFIAGGWKTFSFLCLSKGDVARSSVTIFWSN